MVRKIALFIVLFTAFIVLLCSCSGTRKLKSSEHTTADIATAKSQDSAGVKKQDSTATAVKENTVVTDIDISQTKTTTDTGSETIEVNLQPVDTSKGVPANDYAGAAKVYDVEVNGNKIHSSQPISNITIRNKKGSQVIEASKIKVKDSTTQKNNTAVTVNKTDSGHKTTAEQSHAVIDSKVKNVSVKRFGISFGFWVFLLIGIVFLIIAWRCGWLAWFVGLFRKKNSNTT